MPSLDSPAVIIPGVLGPMIVAPWFLAYSIRIMASLAGIISVIITTGLRPASIASIPASLANESGVEAALVAGYSLDYRPGLFPDQDCHLCSHLAHGESRCLIHLVHSRQSRGLEYPPSFFLISSYHSYDEWFLEAHDFLYVNDPLCDLIASSNSG